MGTTEKKKEKRTITLTNRPPIRISEADWPVIAKADWHDGREYECDANRKYQIRVRQHENGRQIIYATYSTNYQGERDRRCGLMLDGDQPTVNAINAIAEQIGAPDSLAVDCIASLPPEDVE